MPHAYTDPVATLLTYRRLTSADFGKPWSDYLKLGFSREHVPELIRMATDPDLNDSDANSFEVWAPLHAWRALGQLRAEEAIQPLLLWYLRQRDDDWLLNDLSRIFALIGPAAIPALEAVFEDVSVDETPLISIPECFVGIAREHPAERDRCVGALVRKLEAFATGDPDLNGFVISGLIDLGATEAIDLIRRAFADNQVELQVAGDVEDVEMEMGLRAERSTPPPRLGLFNRVFPPRGSLADGADDEADDRAFGNAPVRRGPKVGRNDPCPCGSGKKYKKCCLNDA
jgi:hypothetical protein